MSRQVTRSIAAFVTGLMLAALTATAAASAGGSRPTQTGEVRDSVSDRSSANLRSPKLTDDLGRKWK